MKTSKKIILASFLLLLIGASNCALTQELTKQEELTADFGAYPYNYKESVQAWFNQRLYDPYSAIINVSDLIKAKDGKKYGYKCVATVNAKNRMGGYVGDKIYIFMFRNNEMWETDQLISGFYNMD